MLPYHIGCHPVRAQGIRNDSLRFHALYIIDLELIRPPVPFLFHHRGPQTTRKPPASPPSPSADTPSAAVMSQASVTTGLPKPKNYDSVHISVLGDGLYTQEKVKPLEEYLLQQVGGCR